MDKVTFTREEIESRVKVPAIVEVELRHLVEERLKQCGLYYRIFSRIKTADSLARKYQIKDYGEKKKIQDLIGLRIDVYFEDDLHVCQKFLAEMFSLVEWSRSEQTEAEFKPVKINGVFRLPMYLRKLITDDTWDMAIDDTFEIQLKTVFFEGWHEIEHDMKYKGGELWEGRVSFARYFNSILATLELCDKSLVTLFENLGHDLYKDGNWSGMMKAHYRLKMQEVPMYPELEQILDEDKGENNIGKILFKTDRQVLIDELFRLPRRVPINVNTIAALINRAVIHDDRLTKLFDDKDVFDDGNEQFGEEVSFRQMEPLRRTSVFHAKVNLSTFRMERHEACLEAGRLTFQWLNEKYGRLFRSFPHQPESFERNILGYQINFNYEPERDFWSMRASNIDLEAPGQVWLVEAVCWLAGDGRQMLLVDNSYAVAEERFGYLNRYFSCPRFYSNIADRIGVFDVRYCSTSRRILRDRGIDKVIDLIQSGRRTFPVCLFFSPSIDNGWLNEEWLEKFRVYDFTRMAGRYTHIYTGDLDAGKAVAEGLGIAWDERPGVWIFPAGSGPANGALEDGRWRVYHEEDVINCSYGRQQLRNEGHRYVLVRGGQAFYYKLLHEMRDEMLDAAAAEQNVQENL